MIFISNYFGMLNGHLTHNNLMAIFGQMVWLIFTGLWH